MAEITPALVGKLREMTNAGLMACKNALVASNGDLDQAVDILRKKGAVSAVNKADREAKEGLIAQALIQGGKIGVLVEVNCETDFVARNDGFKEFANGIAAKLAADPTVDLEPDRIAAVAKIGENIQIRRFKRLEAQGVGGIAAYIHTGAKVGVLVEIGATKEASVGTDEFKQLLRDVTLQIAAASPVSVSRADVPVAVVEKEKEIASQSEAVKNKPPQAVAKIIEGKLAKFFETACLLEQGFVKNPELKVEAHVGSVAKQLGDTITVRRFLRFQLAEAI
ncbi:MAG TPA: translation elongation factor Ts [Candidatus Limnocylindria bacterium]|nr:translation elongation factor Ts [Candidatus Limnocylindria bacterium]